MSEQSECIFSQFGCCYITTKSDIRCSGDERSKAKCPFWNVTFKNSNNCL